MVTILNVAGPGMVVGTSLAVATFPSTASMCVAGGLVEPGAIVFGDRCADSSRMPVRCVASKRKTTCVISITDRLDEDGGKLRGTAHYLCNQ